ncbi:MAG: response regulator [Planctomycetes bacterium]|nr:response regulator [Planctomycetota bacterium]
MKSKGRILIVDDKPINISILCALLEPEFTLETAGNGEECLEKCRRFEPDLVLLDIVMPGINGYEVCHRIKSSPVGGFTQVILVSGRASPEERLQGYESQADDYIVKPFDHDELLWKVRVQFRLRDAHARLFKLYGQIEANNAELEQRVAERTAEVTAVQDLVVFSLAKLADSRDPDTGEHLVRIRAYSQILAKQLSRKGPYVDEIDDRFLNDLYRASPLHDIGKVGIPDAILQKPGRLTNCEFELMKQHVIIGAEALEKGLKQSSAAQFLQMAVDVTRYHHERFDGTGYCAGLSGCQIPLSARIVALADVYDALTSKRTYKPAFQLDTAWEIIVEASGSHFDPAIVDGFRVCYDEFLQFASQDVAEDLQVQKEIACLVGA